MLSDGNKHRLMVRGSVDRRESVRASRETSSDIGRLRTDPRLRVEETTGLRLVYLGLDLMRPEAAFVRGPQGEAPVANPLRDARVRQAAPRAKSGP